MSEHDVNLAALWVPVMAETSHIVEQMKKAGEEGRKAFETGFGPDEFAKKLAASLKNDAMRAAIKDWKDQFGQQEGQVTGTNFSKGLSDGFKDSMPGISGILEGGIVAGLTAA